ncbi:immunoglobulin superfamily member 5 isoform X2 [Rhinatrema bivittatum]|uniref:immunoglobulin superfamily member 5 isoform X2 n=1 Tax=Rhinatrema bivittatum TaxID=194408 RepID=UPI00112D671F|nr:immunoglobulin superfamily member 5 isoform X2 [Rhinatrema bivittatum]
MLRAERMDRTERFIPLIPVLLATLTGGGFCINIVQGPINSTVLKGSVARFNCTVTSDWNVLIWLAKDSPVLTVVPARAIISDTHYTQQNYSSSLYFTSELNINDVTMNDSGKVECNLQTYDSAYAYLSVQDYSKTQNTTEVIIIAVTVSIAAVLLIIIIILLIICCCKKRREDSSYQSELRKVSAEKSKENGSRAQEYTGKENPGYIPEVPRRQGPLPGFHYPLPAKFPDQECYSEVDFVPKVPDRPERTFDPGLVSPITTPGKTRHVTHV